MEALDLYVCQHTHTPTHAVLCAGHPLISMHYAGLPNVGVPPHGYQYKVSHNVLAMGLLSTSEGYFTLENLRLRLRINHFTAAAKHLT